MSVLNLIQFNLTVYDDKSDVEHQMNENDLAACKTVVSRHYKIRLTCLQYLEDYSYSCKGGVNA